MQFSDSVRQSAIEIKNQINRKYSTLKVVFWFLKIVACVMAVLYVCYPNINGTISVFYFAYIPYFVLVLFAAAGIIVIKHRLLNGDAEAFCSAVIDCMLIYPYIDRNWFWSYIRKSFLEFTSDVLLFVIFFHFVGSVFIPFLIFLGWISFYIPAFFTYMSCHNMIKDIKLENEMNQVLKIKLLVKKIGLSL